VGGEVRDPQRNIPRALIGGVMGIMVLYLFVNAAYFYVLAPEAVASVSASSSVALETAMRFLGPAAVGLMAAGLMASSFGTLHTSILAGSRITYAMAQDGLLPKTLAGVTPRSRVPAASVLLHGTWASILALSGSFDTLTDYVIFGSWIFYGMAGASVFVLRRKWPDAPRPYRAWGYPVVPALFLLVTGFLLVNTLVATPVQALSGLGLILLGLPVYWFYARRLGPEPPPSYWTGGDPDSGRV
jgi:APA family basic amino acid/polyamine antiporter